MRARTSTAIAQHCKELVKQGFKQVPTHPYLYVNAQGRVCVPSSDKELQLLNGKHIRLGTNIYLNVAKLVLLAFTGEPYRAKEHIKHLDENTANFSPSNLKYANKYARSENEPLNKPNLHTAIRCYHEVPKRFVIKDHFQTRVYLRYILKVRAFYLRNADHADIGVFKTYMSGTQNNFTSVAAAHGISIHDTRIIVHRFLNMLSSEVLADLEAVRLQVLDYAPKPKTRTQALREWNEYMKHRGLPPIPLRKKSHKELYKEYKQQMKIIFEK